VLKKFKELFTISVQLTAMSLIALAITNCSGGKMEPSKTTFLSIKDVPAEAWQKLSQKKIYFGHQSVGQNIIDGIKDVMKENPQIKLNIMETKDPKDFNSPIFAHSPVGKNMDPASKCDAFADYMARGLGQKVDIAFFKFCYIDILHATDIDKVFAGYQNSVALTKKSFPNVTIIHITTPLRVVQTGPRVWVKKIIGKPIGGYDDNVKREQFNAMLRKEYTGKEPIFDLAGIESTSQDGSRATFEKDGKVYPTLASAYTNDGGHLNELGRKVVAEQFLIFLANLTNK
jgi:hypothetical protein